MDWETILRRLETLVCSSPENNRRALVEFLSVSEQARTDESLEGAKALWWIASMVDQRMGAKEAELLYVFAVQKLESILGPDSPLLAGALHSLGYYLAERNRFDEAETQFRRIIGLRQFADQQQSADMTKAVKEFAGILRKNGQNARAQRILGECGLEG